MEQSSTNNHHLILQPRDKRLLVQLRQLKLIDRGQAARIAPFTSSSRAKARLLALVRAGYLNRFFVGTIAGGRRAIYYLPGTRRDRGRKELTSPKTEAFVEHQLAVNEVYLATLVGDRRPVTQWHSIDAPLPDSAGVIPDAFLTSVIAGRRVGMFVEMDLDTESHAVWTKKVSGYLRLAQSAYVQQSLGLSFFRVLVIARTEDRIQAIRSVIARSTDKVFWMSTTTAIKSEGFWSAIWLRPTDDQKRSLS